MKPWLISFLVLLGAFLIGARAGFDYASKQCSIDITKLEKDLLELDNAHAHALAEAQAKYQDRLSVQLRTSKEAERVFLAKQQQLSQVQQALKEKLNEATTNARCTVGTEWMQHYRQALGIGRVPTTDTGGSHTARGVADAAITPAELLHHLTDYGYWCRANTEQLTALQNLIKQLNYGQE